MVGSGLPVPRRRALASGILPSARSTAAYASPSWLRVAADAGSRGTGSPSLSSCLRSRRRVSDADCPARGFGPVNESRPGEAATPPGRCRRCRPCQSCVQAATAGFFRKLTISGSSAPTIADSTPVPT